MTGSSVLPVTIHKGKLVFLFGKENPKENGAKGFSDFGGGVEKGESIYETAMREGGEELTGFLGDGKNLRKIIKRNGGHFRVSHEDYHVHLFYIPYDPNLVTYYNLNHEFLWKRMNQDILNKSKLFEKIEIQWFDVHEAKKRVREFRSFYQHVLRAILKEEKNIIHFIKSRCLKNKRKTRKKNQTEGVI